MHTVTASRFALLMIAAVAAVGAIDAAIASTWDLVVLFAVISIAALGIVVHGLSRRRAVAVRADLARWLAVRASDGGERVDDVVDRAIAAYRAGISVEAGREASG